jgi:hypothetical protein
MLSHDLDLLVVNAIDRLMTGGIIHEHDAFANLTPRELRAKRRESNRQVTTDQSKGQDDSTATFFYQSENEEESKSDFPSPPEVVSTEPQRIFSDETAKIVFFWFIIRRALYRSTKKTDTDTDTYLTNQKVRMTVRPLFSTNQKTRESKSDFPSPPEVVSTESQRIFSDKTAKIVFFGL